MAFHSKNQSKTVKRGPPTRMKTLSRGDSMRNLVGGLLGIVVGSCAFVGVTGLLPPQPAYPEPFNTIWFILDGSWSLQSTIQGLFNYPTAAAYLISWIIIGMIIAPFSRKGWNTLRSALWVGVFLAIFALISLLLKNPSFWDVALNPMRNYALVIQFAMSMVASLFVMISALPITAAVEMVRRTAEPPIPGKIETVCQCGAVFKSNPLICSECGAILRNSDD